MTSTSTRTVTRKRGATPLATFAALAVLTNALMYAPPALAGSLSTSLASFTTGDGPWSPLGADAPHFVGKTIAFKISYMNENWMEAAPGEVVFKVPSNVVFIAASDEAAVTVSMDGGRTFGPLRTAKLMRNGGCSSASRCDVTHVRWRINHWVQPGDAGKFWVKAVEM